MELLARHPRPRALPAVPVRLHTDSTTSATESPAGSTNGSRRCARRTEAVPNARAGAGAGRSLRAAPRRWHWSMATAPPENDRSRARLPLPTSSACTTPLASEPSGAKAAASMCERFRRALRPAVLPPPSCCRGAFWIPNPSLAGAPENPHLGIGRRPAPSERTAQPPSLSSTRSTAIDRAFESVDRVATSISLARLFACIGRDLVVRIWPYAALAPPLEIEDRLNHRPSEYRAALTADLPLHLVRLFAHPSACTPRLAPPVGPAPAASP